MQRKAQVEIDNVVGTGRFPTLKDRPSMPYVQAIIKETMRWHPVAPQGMPLHFRLNERTCSSDLGII